MSTGALIFYGFLGGHTLGCGYALWRGGAPERWAAAALQTALALTVLTTIRAAAAFGHVQQGVFLTDVALLAALVALALYAERYWTLWIAGFQLVAVLLHVARAVDPAMMRSVYAIVQKAWAYPMLGLLIAGAVRHRARLTRSGGDASWSISSRR